MKRENLMEYTSPMLEVYTTTVEHGFGASYGVEGEAGDGFDTNDFGDF